MKRLQTIAMLLTTTALSTHAFAAGENISNEPLLPAPSDAEKKDSEGFLGGVLSIPTDQKPAGNSGAAIKTLDVNEFSRLYSFGGGSTAFPGNTFDFPRSNIDGPMDNGLRYSSRINLNFDTSFTGKDQLRVRITDSANTLFGGADDVIYGGSSDTLSTDDGSDLIYGGPSDSIYGGTGADETLYGGAGPDQPFQSLDRDLNYGLPVFGGQDTLRPTEQPRISANIRDEVAIGFNVGYGARYEDYISLRYDGADATINNSYDDLPAETLTLTVGAKTGSELPNLTSYTYASDFGQANVQTTDTFGFAFPDLFVEGGPVDGAATWPPRGNSPETFDPFYKFPQSKDIKIIPSGLPIFQPEQDPNDVIIGTLRTTFKF